MKIHPLEKKLNAPAHDVLSAIEQGFRAIIDVKGKLAEFYLNKHLERLQKQGKISRLAWSDKDGIADFQLGFRGKTIQVECKNIRSGSLFRDPPAYRVELQRTRNSKDGTNTRGYRVDEFDILAVSLFNHTGKWEYLFACTRQLERRPDQTQFLKIMQRVPLSPQDPWHANIFTAINVATKIL